MPIVNRGTELGRIAEIVPGAVQSGEVTGLANKGKGTGTITPVTDIDYGIIRMSALDGYTRNNGGNPITGYDLGGVNTVFSDIVAYLYPGAASDDNDVQFEIPIPQDMDLLDPDITVIVHFLIPDAPYTPAPIPGGLPIGCEGSFLMYISGAYESVKFTVDNLGYITTDNTGLPVVSEC